ncbi:glycosyltransferase family 4 protein [Cohnella abietis]|uniref:Glycosyl transferase family 1 domain-containing protein n=1 Tax=Cohnella abietis TaxID=2507935 RepID=A0A3T1DCJ1_9BACL|nr:glycosyltransferase family 4 protein [Cohnella abietis]BBI35678.1 hypothetical protein KCTCHS21_50770 [Cohnella abietis]
MKKVAYFSPLNPIRSGISDYSEDILPYLAKSFEIDLYVPTGFVLENESIKSEFSVRFFSEFERKYRNEAYDIIIYHMGNNYEAHREIYDLFLRYPGIVVLHDYSLHHFFASKTLAQGHNEQYCDEMLYSHVDNGLEQARRFLSNKIRPLWETASLTYPLNLRILNRAQAVIVHSEFANKLLRDQASYVPIFSVPMPSTHVSRLEDLQQEKEAARQALGIAGDDIVIASLGHANPTKRIHKVIEVLSYLKKNKQLKRFKYYVVGEVATSYHLREMVKQYGLQDHVIITGYVKLDEFETYIAASDICVNLRYPTQGESSASLLKILGHGKPVIATNIGSFGEFPAEIVHKVGYDDSEVSAIAKAIVQICESDQHMIQKQVLEFVNRHHTLQICADQYANLVDEIVESKQANVFISLEKVIENYTEKVMEFGTGQTSLEESLQRFANEVVGVFNRDNP